MRKNTTIKLTDRKNELTFKITEMSATQLESWTMQALLLLAKGGINTPDNASLEESAAFIMQNLSSILGSLSYKDAKPLLDEMLACCSRVDAGVEQVCTPETVDGYIEDMRTLLKLRIEAVKFNFGFLSEEKPSTTPNTAPITVKSARKS